MNIPQQFLPQLGVTIRNNRKRLSISQLVLAEKAGVTRRYIQELENGRSDISLQTLYCLAVAMETSLSSLMAEFEAVLQASDNCAGGQCSE